MLFSDVGGETPYYDTTAGGRGVGGSRSDNRTTVGDGQSIEQPAATQFLLSRVDKDMRVKPKQETGIIIMPPPR